MFESIYRYLFPFVVVFRAMAQWGHVDVYGPSRKKFSHRNINQYGGLAEWSKAID
jgi:hypothetical protein